MSDVSWSTVLGQPAASAAMRAALAEDEVAHAWLFVGPEGVGQAELTRSFGAALNCPESDVPDQGCGECSTCTRIGRGTHPAVRDFEPEGQFHVVSAVREEWIPAATRTMTEGRRKVLRIVDADRMNEASQNAFLKVLEEPPASVVWLLEARDTSVLLDTIVSRCRRLDLVPWGPEALTGLAATLGIDEDRRPAMVRASMGSPTRLRDLADPELAEARDRALGVVNRFVVDGPGIVVPVAKEFVDWSKGRTKAIKKDNEQRMEDLEAAYGVEGGRGWPSGVKQRLEKRFTRLEKQEQRRALGLFLDDLASYLRDIAAIRSGADPSVLVNLDHADEVQRDAQRLPAVAAVEGLAAIERCREALERNGQPELQLERLLLTIALPLFRADA